MGKVEDIVVIEAVPSALQGSERQHLLLVDCEDPDCLVSGLVAWYAPVNWFPDEMVGPFLLTIRWQIDWVSWAALLIAFSRAWLLEHFDMCSVEQSALAQLRATSRAAFYFS